MIESKTYYVLLEGYWCFSMNAGEECQSSVVHITTSKEAMDKYMDDKSIVLGNIVCDHSTAGEDELTADKQWYYLETRRIDDD